MRSVKAIIRDCRANLAGWVIVAEKQKVFVDVDTQRDFLDVAGALHVPRSDEIRPNLSRLTQCAIERGFPIIATACAHTLDDEELRHFPPHCLAGTVGQSRIPETEVGDAVVLGVDARLEGEPPRHLTLEKREYDVFSRSDATAIMARYNKDKPTFVVYGVATDYCVRAVVLGLLERRMDVAVVVDAIRAIDATREPALLTEFARKGGMLTTTDHVCRAPKTVS